MARERSNPQPGRTFRRLGLFAEKKTDMYNALRGQRFAKGLPQQAPETIEPGGHPDYTWLSLAGPGGFVEVKDGDDNFNFAEIKPKQRDWLNDWLPISWLWLFMGTGRNGTDQRAAYLIPWKSWLEIEEEARVWKLSGMAWQKPHQMSIREAGLSIDEMCAPHKLKWIGDNCWDIPETHCFWSLPIEQVSLFAHPNVNIGAQTIA